MKFLEFTDEQKKLLNLPSYIPEIYGRRTIKLPKNQTILYCDDCNELAEGFELYGEESYVFPWCSYHDPDWDNNGSACGG